jgi:DNA repair exonuclease SbcCD ATPase subunit
MFKNIVIDKLVLHNFKGIKDFTLKADGNDISAFGDNATGKTTLFDAFVWLLFGKDSDNRSNFEIKGLNSSGQVKQHKLEHEVEGVFKVNGKLQSFRRVFKEDWTKKRGAIIEEFTGHATAYYVDGVPVKEKEYLVEIQTLVQEDVFKLLTNPSFFNEKLKKEERRKVLLEICGDITDAEVIHSKKELEPLEVILKDRDITKHAAVVKERMKRINDDIKDIPVRISEAQRGTPDVSELSEEFVQEDIKTLRARVTDRTQELDRIRNGGEIANKERRLTEIVSEQLTIKSRLQSTALDAVSQLRDKASNLHRELDKQSREAEDSQNKVDRNKLAIDDLEKTRKVKREEFLTVNAEEFLHNSDDHCPVCSQILPEEQRTDAHEKALAAFNKSKSERLEAIRKQGHDAKDKSDKLILENERLMSVFTKTNDLRQITENESKEANTELERLRTSIPDPTKDPVYAEFVAEAERIHSEREQLLTNKKDAIDLATQAIEGLREELGLLEIDYAKFDQVRKQQKRIADLEQEESKLAGEYEQLQQQLFLTEEFTRTKVSLMQSSIDSKFKFASFRLFENQINGGLKEVCDTLYNGVPYDGGLNNAARINVGLDIINTLSQHYKVSAPIFIDNAEAVTQLVETEAQVIRLVVSKLDKKLRLEFADESISFNRELDAAVNSLKRDAIMVDIEVLA